MLNLTILQETAALGGYTIGSSGQDATNKARAQRRLNLLKADIISRYGGKWDANYKEGWLPLSPLYNAGTADFTQGSRTVTGHSTVWTTSMKGQKILAPDGAQYKIASVTNGTTLVITQPFQGTSETLHTYQIWQDEYLVYPDVLTLAGFIDYKLPQAMTESWPRNMKDSFPNPTTVEEPTVYTVIGRERYSATYSTGTVSGTINTNVLTGSGTAWLDNIQPGYEMTIGSYVYHVLRVNSDTELELHQQLVVAPAGATYSAKGKNALKIRFKKPTNQRIVHYWYWGKDYPFVNDNDEDWVAEMFPRVIVSGIMYYDYIDKNDVARGNNANDNYESMIKNMRVAVDGAMTGVRTLGYYVPPEARD